MLATARPSWFTAISTYYFATHFCSLDSYSDNTLKDQIPRTATGTAANRQSQP